MNASQVTPLRHVVIGAGAGIFKLHRPIVQSETSNLVAVSDIDAELGQQRANEVGCRFYPDHRSMVSEVNPEVAVILTPHPFHAQIAIDCLQAGCHVLVEKPMAIQVAEADAMIEAAESAGRLLAVNFQQRHRPEVITAHKLIREGALGVIQHVDMSVVWPRTVAYFERGLWRGTWAGEGGGVLMNQAPHDLDLICYLMGLPSRLFAWTRNLLHQIETEDTIQAMLEWPDGAMGSLHISTAEAGKAPRLEVTGTGGCMEIGPERLELKKLDPDMRRHVTESTDPFGKPEVHSVPVNLEPGTGDHASVYRNLHEAILNGQPLIADGAAGRMSLELANAMTYSSYTRSEVELPLDRGGYAALLEDLKAGRLSGVQPLLRDTQDHSRRSI